jgi:hypothetical protein
MLRIQCQTRVYARINQSFETTVADTSATQLLCLAQRFCDRVCSFHDTVFKSTYVTDGEVTIKR